MAEVLERIGPPPVPKGELAVSPAVVAQTITSILDEKARFIPKAGFNLVGADRFDPPGECLYLISHHDTREDAERAMAAYPRGMDSVFIYGPDDL